jgi:hypothetical protein
MNRINDLTNELMERIQMQDLDLFRDSTRGIIENYLNMAYTVGYEDGLKHHTLNRMKPVRAVNGKGERIFESINAASRGLGLKKETITRSLENFTKTKNGYRFYRVDVLGQTVHRTF